MTSNVPGGGRILGSLRLADGVGAVRIEDHYDTVIDDLWAALTDPVRLARWYGQVDGDLRPGGEFRLYVESADLESTGRVDACEPPRRLLVTTRPSWSSRSRASPSTRSPSTGSGGRSTPKISLLISPDVSAATPRRAGTSSFLSIRTWRPTSARRWPLPD